MPVLQVGDTRAPVAFHARAGFGCGWRWRETDERVCFAIVQRGDVTPGPQSLRGLLRLNAHGAAFIHVDDLPALHTEFTAAGLAPTEIGHPDHCGCDDVDMRDPDGHLLAFGQSHDPTPGPGLSMNQGKG